MQKGDKMSRMGEEYSKQMERKFGDVLVSNDALCNFCGQRYGDHYGLTCPPQECPLCGKPSSHSEVHKECAGREAMKSSL